MNNLVLVIHEKDLSDNEDSVIGVADSVKNAETIIKDWYGDPVTIEKTNIEDFNIEYKKTLWVEGAFKKYYKVEVTLEWFILNKI